MANIEVNIAGDSTGAIQAIDNATTALFDLQQAAEIAIAPIDITADASAASEAIDTVTGEIEDLPDGEIVIEGDAIGAEQAIADANAAVEDLDQAVEVTIDADTIGLEEKIAETQAMIDSTRDSLANLSSELTGMSGGASAAIGDIDSLAGTAAGGFDGMASAALKAAGVGGLGALAAVAGSTLIDLGQMGEESAQIEARLDAMAGGADKAAVYMAAMEEAVGDNLTVDDKMIATTRILSLGLADNADEAANLTKIAVTLGGAQMGGAAAVERFTQMLVTGQTRGLAAFGLSVSNVKEAVDLLKESDENLTQAAAVQQIVMEQGAEKMGALEAAGYQAITSTKLMQNATDDLKDSVADLIAQPYELIATGLAQGAKNLTALIQSGSSDEDIKLKGLENQLIAAQKERATMNQPMAGLSGILGQDWSAADKAKVDAKIAEMQAAVDAQKKVIADRQAMLAEAALIEDAYTPKAVSAAKAQVGGLSPEDREAQKKQIIKNAEELALDMVESSTQAYTDALAKAPDKSKQTADALLGTKPDKEGKTPAVKAVQSSMNTLVASMGAEINSKDFAGAMIGYGDQVWSYFEDGMIGRAKSSGALQAAIEEMVLAALGGAP